MYKVGDKINLDDENGTVVEVVGKGWVQQVKTDLDDSYISIFYPHLLPEKLVFGGNCEWNSNRAKESAWELMEVPEEVVEEYKLQISNADSIENLKRIIKHMADNNINIVGSRAYVYMTSELLHVIDRLGILYPYNYLPRTIGIRAKAIELCEL